MTNLTLLWIVWFACIAWWAVSMYKREFSVAFALAVVATLATILISSGVVK